MDRVPTYLLSVMQALEVVLPQQRAFPWFLTPLHTLREIHPYGVASAATAMDAEARCHGSRKCGKAVLPNDRPTHLPE